MCVNLISSFPVLVLQLLDVYRLVETSVQLIIDIWVTFLRNCVILDSACPLNLIKTESVILQVPCSCRCISRTVNISVELISDVFRILVVYLLN